jgi:hypothetical protein
MHYSATTPGGRPAGDYTPRIIGRHGEMSIPLEYDKVVWLH